MTPRAAAPPGREQAGGITGTHEPGEGATVRCNAPEATPERAPQRTPRAPDTAWGRPRAKLGWSLRELADRTGINAGELSRIERGRSCPTPAQARRLVAAFGEAVGE